MSDVTVKVGAETSGLQTGLQQAQGHVKKFATDIGHELSGIKHLFTAAFAMEAVKEGIAKAFEFVHSIVEMAGELQDMADRTNVSAEALQGLNQFFGENGAKAEDVTKGLMKINNALEEAKTSVGPARDAFDKLGITWEQIRDSNPEQMLTILAGKMQDGSKYAENFAALSGLLGEKVAIKLVPALRQGAEEMEKFKESFKGMSNAEVKIIDDTADKFDRLTQSAKAWVATNALLPLIYGIGKKLGRKDITDPVEAEEMMKDKATKRAVDEAMAPAGATTHEDAHGPEGSATAGKEDPKVTAEKKAAADAEAARQKKLEAEKEEADKDYQKRSIEEGKKKYAELAKLEQDLADAKAKAAEAQTQKDQEEADKRVKIAQAEFDKKKQQAIDDLTGGDHHAKAKRDHADRREKQAERILDSRARHHQEVEKKNDHQHIPHVQPQRPADPKNPGDKHMEDMASGIKSIEASITEMKGKLKVQ